MINKIQKSFDGKFDFTAILLGFTISILIYFIFFSSLIQPPLKSFPDRSIGIVVLSGIDANLRTLYYCLTIIFTIVLLFCLVALFSWANKSASQFGRPVYFRAEQSMQFMFSLFSLFLVIYAVIREELVILNIAWILLLFIAFFYYFLFIKIAAYRKFPGIFDYYKDYSVVILSFMLSFSLLFVRWIIWGIPLAITTNEIIFYFLFNVVFITLYPIILNRIGLRPQIVRGPNIIASLLLAFIPASLPISNEIHYTLSGITTIQPQDFARMIVGIFFAASIFFYLFFLWRKITIRTSSVVANYILPAIIIGFYLMTAVDGILTFKTFDLFHNGERMLVTQQLFSFGRIPFVDIIPTHGIMDFFDQAMYSAVNGYHGPEMFLWRWMPVLAGILMLYYLLARLTSPLFSFLLILLLPEGLIINDYYRFCIIIPLVVLWLINRPDLKRYMVLWLTIILLFFWRYDFGVIAAISSICIIPGIFHHRSKGDFSLITLIRHIKTPLIAMGVVIAATLILYSAILYLNGQNPYEMLRQFYIYFKIQAPTQSLVQVYHNYSLEFFLEYIISPAVSILYIVFYLYTLLSRRGVFKRSQIILVWVAMFAIVMTIRTIQRHTILEGFNPVLSIFLLCAAPFYFTGISKWAAHAVFLFIFLFYTMLLVTMPKKVYVKFKPSNLIPQEQFYDFFSLPDKTSRVMISDSSQFKNFSRFCDTYLEKNQTFFDFSNAPLLYVFADRLFPAHIIPNLFQAADPIERFLLDRLDGYLKKGQMPLVLFKQNTRWDSIDGVPQPVRSYLVSEFIYKNYKPFAVVDNYEIWKDKMSNISLDQPNRISPRFRHENKNMYSDIEIKHFTEDSVLMRTFGRDPYIYQILDPGNGITLRSSTINTLNMKFHSSVPGDLQIFYSVDGSAFNEILSDRIQVGSEQGIEERTIVLPKFKNGSVLTDIRFDPPTGAEFCLYRPVISESNFVSIERTDPQYFNLKKLPYIWANFDDKNASTQTEVIEDHHIVDSILGAGEIRSITTGKNIDKSHGNYLHLFLSSTMGGKVSLFYGGDYPSTVEFDLEPTGKVEQYLIRISTQWAWMNDQVDDIKIRPSVPVVLKRVAIRKGD
ncbi:MAG: hypothetical protein Q8M08_08415 [Bacteroidales bacterium]|nr:hypothetical protein [Bacteroidales bacterium]